MMEKSFAVKVMLRDKTVVDCALTADAHQVFSLRLTGIELDRNEFSANDYFEAMKDLRKLLDVQGALLLCAGARVDVFPSAMSRAGYKAYITKLGVPGRQEDLISIFDYANPELIGSVAQQEPFSNWSCPLPLADYPTIVMGHGGGGKLSNELVEHLFLPAFRNPALENLGDAAVLDAAGARLALSTDSFVVQPLFFPGGSIGDLAVNGTVNDLAVSGAEPKFLSASFILEEGFALAQLAAIVNAMAKAAAIAGVQIVTGDTKVVERGHGDGCYVNTAGVGVLRAGIQVGPHRAQPGDAVIVSGTIGDHGMAIMSVREGLEFESPIRSDCAALNGIIGEVLDAAGAAVHAMRDPTRGGLASTLNEIAQASDVGIVISETSLPMRAEVQSACDLLGLDPVYVANEGKAVFFVSPEAAERLLEVLRAHSLGKDAARIGHVTAEHKRMLVSRTAMGANRVIPTMIGEQLPRIC